MICKNCSTRVSGKYCPACGQKTSTDRITFPYLLHEIPHSIFHVDRGLFFTARELFIRPAASMKEYFEGRRVSHFKPFAYLIILTTVNSFISHFVRSYIRTHYDIGPIELESSSVNRFIAEMSVFFKKYKSIFYFIMIPLLSVCSWLFFHKKYNYWEHFTLNTYLTSQYNFILIVSEILLLFKPEGFNMSLFLGLFFTYLFLVYSRMFRNESKKSIHYFKMTFLIILIGFVYITGLSFAGIMTPWWGA